MSNIRVMMVDDEPLIRKAVRMEMNERGATVESGDDLGTELRRVEMVDTFASGPSLMAALETAEVPDYLLVDMEFQGEPTGGLLIARRIHEQYPQVRIIIFSGRFDHPLSTEERRAQRVIEIGRVVMEALRLGASAFVSKNAAGGFAIENILRAIACLERGEQFYFNYPVMMTLKEAAEHYFNLVGSTDYVELAPAERTLLLLEAAGCTASEIASRLEESDKSVQERQKDLSRRLDIVNKSAARVAKALSLGLINPEEIRFLPRN
ncbi:MAG: response regulator transcription factor [Bacteroidales bacterium]|nr:response regulator transcription factor [Bacteroidales bacterium]